ncbi:hypothetical protein EVAR_7898_1 [Eumeta japonica]|uniref:Uncharacterized protein n=1 Tax=Eumeta variegata TaxID=151549 RepID=A0A4C1TV51_EUMVA|nr:hypothetical protein EVAR_7898_1 [Eumeta japonica]
MQVTGLELTDDDEAVLPDDPEDRSLLYKQYKTPRALPGSGGDIALEVLPLLVTWSLVLKEPAAMLLDAVWFEQLLRFEPEHDRNVMNLPIACGALKEDYAEDKS